MAEILQWSIVSFYKAILCVWSIYLALYQMGHCLSCFKHQANTDHAASHVKKDGKFEYLLYLFQPESPTISLLIS